MVFDSAYSCWLSSEDIILWILEGLFGAGSLRWILDIYGVNASIWTGKECIFMFAIWAALGLPGIAKLREKGSIGIFNGIINIILKARIWIANEKTRGCIHFIAIKELST